MECYKCGQISSSILCRKCDREEEKILAADRLKKMYGKSEDSCEVVGLPILKLGEMYKFKDGRTRQLLHIEYINMAVDKLTFTGGLRLFTDEIDNAIKF